MGKRRIHWLYPVNPTQMGRYNVIHFIIIHSLITNTITVKPDMPMGFHKTGIYIQPFRIHDFGIVFCF